ncbi:MAG: DUF86 domain-containing protein [Bacteroidales bacterium]|nr:DUF86 domain-containing protein [Bacteroidales bacterium]
MKISNFFMQYKIKKHLYDILISANSIFEYLGNKRDFIHYEKNKLLRRAVEREFEIIGEATSRILKIDKNFPINNAERIISLRNYVIHGYDKVDNVIIGGIISRDLPKLRKEVNILLNKYK